MNKKLSEIFKIIFIVKFLLIFVLILLYFGWIQIKENELVAGSVAKETTASDVPKKSDKEKSFFESLLNLPDLDENKVTKEEISRYLVMIEQLKQKIKDKSEVLDKKIVQLKKLEESIDQKIIKLEEERTFFKSTVQKEKKIQKERAKVLVALYEKMEPKKAAPVLETMDKDLVVELFQQMKKKQVTKILESMQTDKSVMISEYFGRVGSAREYDLLKEMNKSLVQAFNDCKTPPE